MAEGHTFECEVLTLDRTVLRAPVVMVTVTAADGEVGVLAHRSPMLAAIRKGQLRIQTPAEQMRFLVEDGVAHVRDNRMTVLVRQCTPL